MFRRLLKTSKSKSFFLFGARGTGKTTLLREQFSHDQAYWIDLLDNRILSELDTQPARLSGFLAQAKKQWVVIDEIQKIPRLLDEVHRLIESTDHRFVLTGSSARKLKRQAANLLAGRAFVFNLYPLTHIEVGNEFQLDDALSYGTLPGVFTQVNERDKKLFLKAYADTYLKEEILIEQLIRKLPPFRKFLELSAAQDTEVTSFTNIARDVGVDPKIISNYYSILEDTLLGFTLEPFHTSIRKRQKATPKFYWFDTGVRRALTGTVDDRVRPQSFEYGSLFESFVVNEIRRLLTYAERQFKLSFLRLDDSIEIDLIVERNNSPTFLIEVKSTDRVHEGHVQALRKLGPSIKNSQCLLLSRDPNAKMIEGISCMDWQSGIQMILNGQL